MEDLDEVQRLAATTLFYHDARQGIPPQGADEAGGAAGAPRTQPADAPRRW
jgi:hypothetical protein